MTAGDDVVLFEKRDGIAWLTINRPQAYNAIDLEARDLIWTLLEVVSFDEEVGVVVFRGAGDRAFCAGMDLATTIPLAQRFARGEWVEPDEFEALAGRCAVFRFDPM